MIKTTTISAMIGAISALAGSAISGEVTVTIFFLCLLAFVAVEATTRFVEIKLHKRFMEDIEAPQKPASMHASWNLGNSTHASRYPLCTTEDGCNETLQDFLFHLQ